MSNKFSSLLIVITAVTFAGKFAVAQSKMGFAIVKGTQNFGLTFSLSAKEIQNDNQLIQYVHQSQRNAWSVSTEGGYTFADYLNTGLRLSIGQSIEKSEITPLNGSISNVQTFARNFTVAPYLMYYIPLGDSKILYLTNRVELLYKYESKLKETVSQDVLNRQHYTINNIGVGLRPGLLVLVQKGFGFEVSLNVLGLTHSYESSTNTGKPETKISTTDIDLKIDILKLNLGFNYYF